MEDKDAAPAGEPARIKVAVTDLGTGDSEEQVISDDYVITCAGSCYVAGVQAYANGTHVITVKGRATPRQRKARRDG
jgi:hypothetical protein